MGSLPTSMKATASLLVLAGVTLGRELLPEEHWRPSQGRDLSKFKPRHAKYGIEGEVSKDEDFVQNVVRKINKPDPFVGEKRNFDDICGIENDGHDPRGKGTCNGDSGGPLGYYDETRERWIEVGIVSFGASAGCEVGYPSGFTRTNYYLDWIKDQAGID